MAKISAQDQKTPEEVDALVCNLTSHDADDCNPNSHINAQESFNTDKVREANLIQNFPENVVVVESQASSSSPRQENAFGGSYGVFTFGQNSIDRGRNGGGPSSETLTNLQEIY